MHTPASQKLWNLGMVNLLDLISNTFSYYKKKVDKIRTLLGFFPHGQKSKGAFRKDVYICVFIQYSHQYLPGQL